MKHSTSLLCFLALASVALSSCSLFGTSSDGASEASSSSSSISVLSTSNVSYVGTVEDIGVTNYQQGTHKLVMEGGQFILLESTDANLNLALYVGKSIEVRGSVQPTVEAGGTIMRVEVVTLLVSDSSSSMSDSASSVPASSASSEVAGSASSAASAVVSSAVSMRSSSPVSSASTLTSSSSSAAVSGDAESKIVALAKQRYGDAGLWTQKYCSSHIAFCIPVHKNWYFKSFGATTANPWHVEFGLEAIEELSQGSIVLNVVNGSSAAAGVGNGEMRVRASDIILYKDWGDGTRHFELIADARLQEALTYMLGGITPYTPGD